MFSKLKPLCKRDGSRDLPFRLAGISGVLLSFLWWPKHRFYLGSRQGEIFDTVVYTGYQHCYYVSVCFGFQCLIMLLQFLERTKTESLLQLRLMIKDLARRSLIVNSFNVNFECLIVRLCSLKLEWFRRFWRSSV